jgi:hypothetical protein
VNRSLACAKPGSCPDASRGRSARTNGTLHSRLKITSSIRRQSRQQDRPEPGLHMRELRRERRAAQQRQLPQPLPGVPVLQARRHRPRRPGLGLPRPDAPRARRTPQRQRAGPGPAVRHLRLRPSQPDRRRPSAGRRHRRDHRADVQSRVNLVTIGEETVKGRVGDSRPVGDRPGRGGVDARASALPPTENSDVGLPACPPSDNVAGPAVRCRSSPAASGGTGKRPRAMKRSSAKQRPRSRSAH